MAWTRVAAGASLARELRERPHDSPGYRRGHAPCLRPVGRPAPSRGSTPGRARLGADGPRAAPAPDRGVAPERRPDTARILERRLAGPCPTDAVEPLRAFGIARRLSGAASERATAGDTGAHEAGALLRHGHGLGGGGRAPQRVSRSAGLQGHGLHGDEHLAAHVDDARAGDEGTGGRGGPPPPRI